MGANSYLESAALLALVRRGDRRWHEYSQLVELNESALAVLAGDCRETSGASKPLQLFSDPPSESHEDLESIVAEILAWQELGIGLVTVLDEQYPSNLRSVHNRPPFLFIRGSLSDLDDRAIAIVGTRNATPGGKEAAAQIAAEAASRDFTVFSGLARGIDTSAHVAALDAGSRTIAVIGTGVNKYYPAENRDLQDEISARFAVVSQFWPDSPPTRHSFPMRNAVMSGLALATVVVEADGKSGARMQARLALQHGRPVFLLRSLLEHAWARDYASRAGASVIEDFGEIFDRLLALEVDEPAFA